MQRKFVKLAKNFCVKSSKNINMQDSVGINTKVDKNEKAFQEEILNQTQQTIENDININDSSKKVNFGFQEIPYEQKQNKVNQVFSSVASKYDIMNDLMSAGIHRLWKQHLVEEVGILVPRKVVENGKVTKTEKVNILDVASGTGDIGFSILDYQVKNSSNPQNLKKHIKLTFLDVNADILQLAKEKAQQKNIDKELIDFQVNSAEDLKSIPDNSQDLYIISFGLRNVPDTQKALDEAYRVLKPGGRFLCMEFSKVENSVLNEVYKQYSFNVIPLMGQIVANDRESYQYLVESIEKFDDQMTLKKRIEKSGFKYVNYENLLFGVVAIHSGYKLLDN